MERLEISGTFKIRFSGLEKSRNVSKSLNVMGISIVEIHLIWFSLLVTVSCKNLFQMKLTCV